MTVAPDRRPSAAASLAGHRPRSATQLWDASIVLVRAHWMPLLLLSALTLLVALPAAAVRIALGDVRDFGPLDMALSLYEIATGSVLIGALVVAVADAWHGRSVDIGAAMRAAGRRAVPLAVVGTLSTIAMMIGLVFLLVPGLLVAARFFAAGTTVVLEARGVGGAFRRSVQLSRGNMQRLLATVGVATLVSGIAVWMLQGFIVRMALVPSEAAAGLLAAVAAVPLTPFLVAVSVVTYFDARIRQEGYDLELAAAALG
jgi:hypothetical protein